MQESREEAAAPQGQLEQEGPQSEAQVVEQSEVLSDVEAYYYVFDFDCP